MCDERPSDVKDQFPYRSLADMAGDEPRLHEEPLHPVRVVQFYGVENPDGVIEYSGLTILTANDQPAQIVIDFGRQVVGYLDITARADRTGSIAVSYGESLEEVLSDNQSSFDWYHSPVDTFQLTPEWQTFRHNGRRAFRYVKIRVVKQGVQVVLKNTLITCMHYPVIDRGSFVCSDSLLNEIWGICRYTTKLCMQRFHEDGIKRDGLLWVSDYRVQFLCNCFAFGDSTLARRSLIMMAASQRADGAIPACAAFGGGHQHPYNIDYMPGIPHGSVDRRFYQPSIRIYKINR